MKITIVGRQMNVWDSTKEMAEKKLQRLDKYFGSEASATVTFSCKRERDNVEITIHGANTIFRAEVDDISFQNAMDRCVEAIDRQIRARVSTSQTQRHIVTDGVGYHWAYTECIALGIDALDYGKCVIFVGVGRVSDVCTSNPRTFCHECVGHIGDSSLTNAFFARERG